jgi:hypothetical protein
VVASLPPRSFASKLAVLTLAVICTYGCASKNEERRPVDLVIAGATAIDPATQTIIANALIAIDGGRIVVVNRHGQRPLTFAGKQTIDASGQFIVPPLARHACAQYTSDCARHSTRGVDRPGEAKSQVSQRKELRCRSCPDDSPLLPS